MAKITKRFVDRLTAGPADVVHWDHALSGFGVRVKPSGAMTYVVQYRNAVSQSKRLTVGKFGVLTPEEARREGVAALASVAKGKDPVADKRAQRADLTVAGLVERYLEEGEPTSPPRRRRAGQSTPAIFVGTSCRCSAAGTSRPSPRPTSRNSSTT